MNLVSFKSRKNVFVTIITNIHVSIIAILYEWHVRPAKTQIILCIRPVWSESSLSSLRNRRSLATHWAHSEDSDQTRQLPRLIWVFAGRRVLLLVLSWGGSSMLHIHVNAVRMNFWSLAYLKFFSSKEQIWNVIQNLPNSDKNCHIPVRLTIFFFFFSKFVDVIYKANHENRTH